MIQSQIREILYCDDTEEQRYAMRRILEGAGYTVIEAGTGAEALEKLHPGVLAAVMDVRLPDISGYEVCRRIKANPLTSAIPVLQISASFADPTLRAHGLEGGADAYVAQPVHPAELLSLVAALVRSHDSDRTLRFQAEISRQLALSLDYKQTFRRVESVFVPRFADHCQVLLRPQTVDHAQGASAQNLSTGSFDLPEPPSNPREPLHPALEELALEIAHTGQACLVRQGTVIPAANRQHQPLTSPTDLLLVPLAVGRRQMGSLIFSVDGTRRQYQMTNLALAQDLADRAALALQNASLYTAQRAAQAALVQSEKLAAAGRLSAAIAHEINNPLEAITNLMYLIDTSEEITPTIKGYVQEALSELSRLTHIARQSLGFYRELTGPQKFDLNVSVEDTLNIYLKRFTAKHVEVERDYAPETLELFGVKGEIRQVISNLLVNAYDASPERGVLRVETAMIPAKDDSPGVGAQVVFRVIDQGSGIPVEVQARIFEPFFTTKQGTGTGLGLWVSNTIVTKHGGTIEVSSRTGGDDHGSTFEVALPVSPPAPVSAD